MEEHVAVGRAIRAMRRGRMSLQELADKSNVSVGSLSQIENGRGNPSLAMLDRIAGALNVDARQLLSSPPTSATAIVRKDEHRRQRLIFGDREVEMLTPDIWHDFAVSRSVMAPGESESLDYYSGEVCILVQRGRMRMEFDSGEIIDLGTGDTINYSIPRKGTRRNIGAGPLVFIGVFCPREM